MKRRQSRPNKSGAPPDAGRRLAACATVLTILLLALVAHLPLGDADYIQDDHLAVEKNPVVARCHPQEIFSTSYWAGAQGEDRSLYRPVTILSFALERKLRGRPDPLLSHAVNLALHLLVSLTLFALALRLRASLSAAAAAALLFSVHPIHVEAVANIVGRAEILATLFTLACLLALSAAGRWDPLGTDGREAGPAVSRLASWGAAVLLFLALGSKEIAMAAPLLMVGVELLFRSPEVGRTGRWLLERATALMPSVLAVLIFLGLRIRALESLFLVPQPQPADNFLVLLGGTERISTALGLVTRAVRQLVFPFGLSIDYSGYVIAPETGMLSWRPLLGLLILAGLVVLTLSPWIRSPLTGHHGGEARVGSLRRQAALAAALFLLPYLVIGNLLVPVGTIFAERLLYLPSAGFCLILGLALDRLAWDYPAFPHWSAEQRARLIGTALVILLGAFSLLTWQRARDWEDDETVFAAAARVKPASPRAHFVLGALRDDKGENDEALALLDRTLQLWPEHVPAWFRKGLIHARRGELALAERMFRETLRLGGTAEWPVVTRPFISKAHLNLGIALHRQGRLREAELSVRRALAWERERARAWAELGRIQFQTGRYGESARAYRKAVSLGRADLTSHLREAQARAKLEADSGPAAPKPSPAPEGDPWMQ